MSVAFRFYLQEKVRLVFDGIDVSDSFIAQTVDNTTGIADESATVGNLLTLHGLGIKLDSDAQP